MLPLREAEILADQVASILSSTKGTAEATVCGSIRRRKPEVGDIEIVCCRISMKGLKEKLSKIGMEIRIYRRPYGPVEAGVSGILTSESGKIACHIFAVKPENYEAVIRFLTGSREHNSLLKEKAKRKGMKLTLFGLMKDGKIVASSDKDLYRMLDEPLLPPEER